MLSTRNIVFPSIYFSYQNVVEGREPCSVLFCSPTLNVLVVVCNLVDTLVIDR